jgi:uncharacterized protein involved in type VI secretion and phage assembly
MIQNGALPTPFAIPSSGLFAACYLAEVVSVEDKLGLGRVRIRLLNFDGIEGQDGPIWARVAVPFAGADRGAFMIPDVGDEVIVNFINGDPRFAVVTGGLWNGNALPPEVLGGDHVDRWTIVGKAGTRIAIVEESASTATILFTTPGGVSGELTDSGGGSIELSAGGATVTINGEGVSISTSGTVKVEATSVEITAGTVSVDAATSSFSGIVKCDTLVATTVTGATYSLGAGNVW